MKYISSDKYNATRKPWIEAKVEVWNNGVCTKIDPTDEIHFIKYYYNEQLYVYDVDSGGDNTVYFAFDTDKCYRLEYEWWITRDPEWEIHNYYTFKEITWDECREHVSSNRDWLVV